MSKFLQLEMH